MKIKISVTKDVISPTEFANFLIDSFSPREHEMKLPSLDMGTGTGILAIALAQHGYEYVDAVDINSEAVTIARLNASFNNVQDKIHVYISNLFDNIESQKKYSLIVCNPPTFSVEKTNLSPIELAFFSNKYGYFFIEKLISETGNYLLEGGRLLVIIPSYHPMDLLLEIAIRSNLKPRIMASKSVLVDDYINRLNMMGIDGHKIIKDANEFCLRNNYQGFNLNKNSRVDSFNINLLEAVKLKDFTSQ